MGCLPSKEDIATKASEYAIDKSTAKAGDVEKNVEAEEVTVTDEEVLAAGKTTRRGLVLLALCMVAFTLGMMIYFAYQLNVKVGGSCDSAQGNYRDYDRCWNLKENWCATMQCDANGNANGQAIDPDTTTQCPQGCSVCSVSGQGGDEALEVWLEQLKRFNACKARTSRYRECLPTMDTDGSLANYRGYKTAHPSSQLGAAEAFIQRDAFLRACDAQEVYADRRDKGGTAVVACIGVALLAWLLTTAYLCRTPDYKKHPRETEFGPLETFSDKKDFNHRFHPQSVWLWNSTASNLFGFALQLWSFYTPSTTDVRIPIAQGAWMTVMVVTRGILVFFDYYTLSEAAAVFFDIGFGAVGFTAVLEPFFEPKITTKLPEVDESITDFSLAVRVISFVYPLVASTMGVKDLYVDNYWPSPATAKALREKKRSLKRQGIKATILFIQLLAALSVYVIMGSPTLCHQFRTCARGTCVPNIPVGAPLDAELIQSNMLVRTELISDDGSKKWRWQINTQTRLSFTKSGDKLYADLTFATPNGAIENNVFTPGTNNVDTVADTTPTSSCATRFEVQCQEMNPRHAFVAESKWYEWVEYNTSMYKFVARHDADQTSGEAACFGDSTEWWTDNTMFHAGPDLVVGTAESTPSKGFVFMEQECDALQNDPDATNGRTKYCLVEPPFVATYSPYGRAAVTGSWQYDGGSAVPDTWATTQHVFELVMSEALISAASTTSTACQQQTQQPQPQPGGNNQQPGNNQPAPNNNPGGSGCTSGGGGGGGGGTGGGGAGGGSGGPMPPAPTNNNNMPPVNGR
jgi:hypothetical protein